jgi:hypothetical protein
MAASEGQRVEAEQLVEILASSPWAVARLHELLGTSEPTVAYTVGSLAAAVGLTPKAVRNAIVRGELAAVKRAGRWIISADAVHRWVTPERGARFVRRSRHRRARPLADALGRVEREVSSASAG